MNSREIARMIEDLVWLGLDTDTIAALVRAEIGGKKQLNREGGFPDETKSR